MAYGSETMGGKREERKERRGLLKRLAAIPHLFAKCIIIHCIVCGTAFSFYSLRILSRTGQDGTALLGVVLAFFGGELLILCLRTVLNEKQTNNSGKGDEPGKEDTYD